MTKISDLFHDNDDYEDAIDDRGGGKGSVATPSVSYKVIPVTSDNTSVPPGAKDPFWRVMKPTGRDFTYKVNYSTRFLTGNLNAVPSPGATPWPMYDYIAYFDLSGLNLNKLLFYLSFDTVFLTSDYMFINGVKIWTGTKPTNGNIRIETFTDGLLKTYVGVPPFVYNTIVPNMLINGVNVIMLKLSLCKVLASSTTIKP